MIIYTSAVIANLRDEPEAASRDHRRGRQARKRCQLH